MSGSLLDFLDVDSPLQQVGYVVMAQIMEPVLYAYVLADTIPGLGEGVWVERITSWRGENVPSVLVERTDSKAVFSCLGSMRTQH